MYSLPILNPNLRVLKYLDYLQDSKSAVIIIVQYAQK